MLHRVLIALLLIVLADSATPQGERLTTARTTDTLHLFSPPATIEAWEARVAKLRTRIEVAAGIHPQGPRDVPRLHSTRTFERPGYTVENVWFESRPGWVVTGNLYRPSEAAPAGMRYAAVLSPHGHWDKGRWFERSTKDAQAEIGNGGERTLAGAVYPLQARCAHLARMGFVVLHYDMVGYADNSQVGHGDGFLDLESELWGMSAFGLQTWNSLRALDALAGLPEVDPARIGATGASGGGTQTFILCAIDPRPKAAFPAVMVSNRMQGGCICENASLLRIDTDNVEFAALNAPRPLALTGADDWTKHILEEGFPELKRIYALYGQESNVAAFCYPEFGHNYNQVSREHMYEWFAKHLAPIHPELVSEAGFEPISPRELRVFGDERTKPEKMLSVGELRQVWLEEGRVAIAERRPTDASSLARFRTIVGGALEAMVAPWVPNSQGVADLEIEVIDAGKDIGNGVVQVVRLRGREMPGFVEASVFVPKGEVSGAVVAASPAGAHALLDDRSLNLLERAAKAGVALVLPDLLLSVDPSRGLPTDAARHGNYIGYTTTYNRTLLAERVRDLLVTLEYAATLAPREKIDLIGLERSGIAVVLASALSPVPPRRTLAQLEFDFSMMRTTSDPDFLPSALRYGGIDAFCGLIAPRELIRVGASSTGDDVRACFSAADAEARLVEFPSDRLLSALDMLFAER